MTVLVRNAVLVRNSLSFGKEKVIKNYIKLMTAIKLTWIKILVPKSLKSYIMIDQSVKNWFLYSQDTKRV